MPTVFKNMKALSFDYVPPSLPHREKELEALFTLFSPMLRANMACRAFLVGPVGTGKTAISRSFCSKFASEAIKASKNVGHVYANCRQRNSENAVMLKIVRHFDRNFPDRGFSASEMLEIVSKFMDKKKQSLIIVLDEVENLLRRNNAAVYNILRFREEFGCDLPISLILISQKFALNMLDSASQSSFGRTNVIEFGKYSRDELYDIIMQRVCLAYHDGAVDEGVPDLIADIAGEFGDARFAIELLLNAGLVAERSGKSSVSVEDVRYAKAHTYPYVSEDKLADLGKHEKLVLLAVSRRVLSSAYACTGDVEKEYQAVCEEFDEKAREHTQFWKYMKRLDSLGLIKTKVKVGKNGKTTLISLPDIPAKVLAEKIEKMAR